MRIKENKLPAMLSAFPLSGLSNGELDKLLIAICKEQLRREPKLIDKVKKPEEKQAGESESLQPKDE